MLKFNLHVSAQAKLFLSLFCVFLGTAAFAQTAKSTDASSASLSGTWKMISETPEGDPIPWSLTIAQTDGHWTGTVATPEATKPTPASDFKVSGDKVHLQTQYQGSPYDIDLKLESGTLLGTWSGDNGSGKTTGKRSD